MSAGKELIASHFDWLTSTQLALLDRYVELLLEVNERVNLISRKDVEHVWTHHILHSLSIAIVISFQAGHQIADVGTGGGLPGIPLAIAFPDASFTLIDSIGKKITAVQSMVNDLGLKNVRTRHGRMEEVTFAFDFVVSRAVSSLPQMQLWLKGKIRKGKSGLLPNGLIYIKGGDFDEELLEINRKFRVWALSDWYDDPFFETKKVVWIDLAG